MYKTFASAEFKKGPQQLSYKDQFQEIVNAFNRDDSPERRDEILRDYFTWTRDEMFTWTTDTRIWNELWTLSARRLEIADKVFIDVYEWLYPNLSESEIQDLDFKQKLVDRRNERAAKLKAEITRAKHAKLIKEWKDAGLIKQWEDAAEIKESEEEKQRIKELKKREDAEREDAGKLYRQRKRDERDERIANKTATPAEIKEVEEEKQRIEEAEEERLEKKTMELKKQTRDKERDNAIKNDEFEKYKFTEPLYVGDIVKVSGYVGRIISISEYPRYHVRTFHDGNSVWCARVSLFRLIPESDDIAYRDDYGDKTYDNLGYKHGYYDAERDGWWEYGDPPDQHKINK